MFVRSLACWILLVAACAAEVQVSAPANDPRVTTPVVRTWPVGKAVDMTANEPVRWTVLSPETFQDAWTTNDTTLRFVMPKATVRILATGKDKSWLLVVRPQGKQPEPPKPDPDVDDDDDRPKPPIPVPDNVPDIFGVGKEAYRYAKQAGANHEQVALAFGQAADKYRQAEFDNAVIFEAAQAQATAAYAGDPKWQEFDKKIWLAIVAAAEKQQPTCTIDQWILIYREVEKAVRMAK